MNTIEHVTNGERYELKLSFTCDNKLAYIENLEI